MPTFLLKEMYFFPKKIHLNRKSRALLKNFIYLRVDLYNINDKIYFAELTLHDGTSFEPFNEGVDEKLGGLIQLPIGVLSTISML